MDEFGIISKYFSPLAKNYSGALGLKDDAAIITPNTNNNIVVTKDAIVENVHFFKNDSAHDIALKLLGVNLSDLAAMGASPLAYLIGVILPKNTNQNWLEEFSASMADGIKQYGGALIGGDTVSHDGPLTLTLTAIGEIPLGKELKRSGAKEGDLVFVSGTIGDSYLGLQSIKGHVEAYEYLQERYHKPIPRIEIGIKLREIASACIDISDGLVADLTHICESSGVGSEINLKNIPLSTHSRKIVDKNAGMLIKIINGGDDYELLFTCAAKKESEITNISKEVGIPIAKIGSITKGDKVTILDEAGSEIILQNGGYKHFN